MKIIVAGAIFSVLIGALGLVTTYGIDGREPLLQPAVAAASAAAAAPLRCVAFGPYVAGYDPNTGPHPPASVIGKLLDRLVAQTDFRCIMTYGVLNGLGRTFPAAKRRGIKVIAIIWLDLDRTVNARSIRRGIRAAKAYPNTIIRLSCGSEVRTRHGTALDDEVTACISALRRAGVSQPITTIDTWWEWCNRSYPCKRMPLAARVDWIGINVFPWWENEFSGLFPCTSAARAPKFHIDRIRDIKATYPGKHVMLTEFGWPAGPAGYRGEPNRYTGERCGVAREAAQTRVVQRTIAKLDALQWPGVVFEAFREPWKADEDAVGPYWGLCKGTRTYKCKGAF